ncbi:MAG: vWA domain-containing protein [Planctomycetota bacterium]
MDSIDLFRHPSALMLLVLPLALLLWTWNRGGNAVVLPFDHAGLSRGAWTHFFLRLFESTPALLMAVVCVLLAGPQAWEAPRTKRVLTNIQFCVDVSGSMTAKFGEGDRYEASMAAINQFLDYRTGDAFGLTFFGNNVLHWVPVTTDISAFRCAPPFMRPQNLPPWFGGTEIGKALMACRKILTEREEGDRMIILITDGYSADLGNGNDETIARELKKDNIVVFSVHIAEGAIPDPIVRLTSLTGGEAFKPEDTDGLKRVFERIDKMKLARMEKSQAEAADDFRPWCLAGLTLLAVSLLALFGLRYTPW